jgi:Transglycosylase-like domain
MSGTDCDHPPSTTTPTPLSRRVLTAGAAVLVTIAAPVALVAATGSGPAISSAAEAVEPATTLVLEQMSDAEAEEKAVALANAEELAQAIAPPTTVAPTTTAAPPAPAPEPAPAPVAEPAPAPAPAPVTSGGGYADPNNPAAWDRLAQCEAGGNWATNTGNGYYGGIQFSLGSWQAVGGTGRPDQASRETQIAMGQRLYNQGGWGHWPACTRKLGYR